MAKLYYGNGNCSIEGSNILAVKIRFKGAIEINNKTPDSSVVMYRNNNIGIASMDGEHLNELFSYIGEFKIIYVEVVDNNGDKVPTSIHKVMDYVELLNTNAEDMTTKSEDLSSTHTYGRKVAKTTLRQPNLNNRHTLKYKSELYLKDGTRYEGYYHIHLADNAAMTGAEHTEDSQDLYYNNGKPTKNPSLVPYGAIEGRKRRKAALRQSKRNRRI